MPIITLNNLTLCSFYDKNDTPYYSLANYSAHPVKIYDNLLKQTITWPTTEHYFQAQKITDKNARAQFVNDTITNYQGPDYCRKNVDKYQPHDPNWHNNQTKQNVMRTALFAKYNQHADVKQLVDSTGNMPIVEDTAGASYLDKVWGCGYDGDGDNWLGRLWMEVRAQMRDGKSPATATLEADTLHQQTKTELQKLGNRKVLLQNHPKVTGTPVSNSSQSTPAPLKRKLSTPSFPISQTPTDILSLAKDLKHQMKRAEKHTIMAKDGSSITYGRSGNFDTFYIDGVGFGGVHYNVYVDDKNQIVEKRGTDKAQVVQASKWADWAVKQIVKASNQYKQFTPLKKSFHSSSATGGIDIIALAAKHTPFMVRGESNTITASDGSSITYGVSGQYGSFYIDGTGKGNIHYNVYVNDKNQIFEKQGNNPAQITTLSKWANWAAKEVDNYLIASNQSKSSLKNT